MGGCMSGHQNDLAQRSYPRRVITIPKKTLKVDFSNTKTENSSGPYRNLFKTFDDWDDETTKRYKQSEELAVPLKLNPDMSKESTTTAADSKSNAYVTQEQKAQKSTSSQIEHEQPHNFKVYHLKGIENHW